jgi:hypothetical protein
MCLVLAFFLYGIGQAAALSWQLSFPVTGSIPVIHLSGCLYFTTDGLFSASCHYK